MADEEGVLGNLPRSRPGQRSAKRANKPADPAMTSRTAPKRAKPAAKRPPPASQPSPSTSPVSGVLRTVTSLAGGGARLAHGAARGVLRRLPRP
jgi:hypothetical protein